MVQRGRAHPWALSYGSGGRDLCGPGMERHPIVQSWCRPWCHCPLVVWVLAWDAAAADRMGGRARGGSTSSTPSHSRWSGRHHGRRLPRTLSMPLVSRDTEKLERLKLAEIKHARNAMLAMLIFYFEARQGKTPLGALGL
ncbi:hypothetical protein AMTR_s00061p00164910 [Amborella trichopoda]|uniref:Uncharacterized protein n=1 Tax=Amborella trichopoda TaxID=13333 RepID=U5DAC5_AMBTC|nr:hypothetical protein AMTR_s00061p00164910 [Amborella trichopoda]